MIFIIKNFYKQNKKIILAISALIILGISIVIIKIIDNDKKDEDIIFSNNILQEKDTQEENMEEDTIIIHITGAVASEGILKIPEGSRIADAIEKAGGLTEEANIKNVNLAYELEDGQKLYIPNINDQSTEEYIDDGISEQIVIDPYENSNAEKIININKATETDLQTLNGIGESTASAIIKYREENGDFETPEDLKNVPRNRRSQIRTNQRQHKNKIKFKGKIPL